MLGNLFKSKKRREMEREMAIRRTLQSHKQLISGLEKHEREYMQKALTAKKQGDKKNFSQLCGMVAQTMNQRRATQSQLLHFETMRQHGAHLKLSKDFAIGLSAMAKSIVEVFNEVDAESMMRDVEESLAQSDHISETMDMVLDRIAESGLGDATPADGVSVEAIERIVGEQAVAEEGALNIDQEIDEGLKAIERELTGE